MSVVIPTRFRPDLVTRAVRSVLAQTVDTIEVVVVVDGPDAATVEAVQDLGDHRIRILELAETGGAPNARNQGILAAEGHWTALLDDDDEWLPTKLERQLELAKGADADRPIVATRLVSR